MKVKDLMKVLIDANQHADVYIDFGRNRCQLEEDMIEQPSYFSSSKYLTINIDKEVHEVMKDIKN